MPSKTKKHNKAQTRASTSEVATPRTPSRTPNRDPEVSEEELILSCEEASKKFPSFIGKSAFIGDVSDVEPSSKGFKIWLSESSMVSFSLAPGSIVSVIFLLSPCFMMIIAIEILFSVFFLYQTHNLVADDCWIKSLPNFDSQLLVAHNL